jgi:hypothetical protein
VTHLFAPFLLRNEPGKICGEARIKPVIGEVEAVLKAADEWVSAQEALVAARQRSEETEAEQEAADIAGSRLVLGVMRWRSSRYA